MAQNPTRASLPLHSPASVGAGVDEDVGLGRLRRPRPVHLAHILRQHDPTPHHLPSPLMLSVHFLRRGVRSRAQPGRHLPANVRVLSAPRGRLYAKARP